MSNLPHGMRDVTAEAERIAEERGWTEAPPPEPDDYGTEAAPPGRGDAGAGQSRGGGNGDDDDSILSLRWFSEVEAIADVADFVEGVLTDGAMSVVYGESNSGKTFFATDLAFRVALGWSWHDRETEQGAVLYLACEGGHGIKNRVAAFRQEHQVTGDVPFAFVPASVNLRDPEGDTLRVIRTADAVRQQAGRSVRLVVVDTLSRALAGGEENSSQDMGALVGAVDEIRRQTGAHVALIHHSGKDTAKGARGHSLLRAATDTEIEVSRPEGVETATATVKKQRDLPGDGLFTFSLRSVQLATDRRGNAVTSCIVEPADQPEKPKKQPPPRARKALDLLREALDEGGETPPASNHIPPDKTAVRVDFWRNYCRKGQITEADKPDAQRKAFKRAADDLQALGIIGTWDGWVWIAQ